MVYLQAARIYLDKRLLEPDDDAAYPDEENEDAGSSGPHLNISVKCLPGLGFLGSLYSPQKVHGWLERAPIKKKYMKKVYRMHKIMLDIH